MKLTLTARSAAARSGTRIIFVLDKKPLLNTGDNLAAAISSRIRKTGFTGSLGQTQLFPIIGKTGETDILLTGLGDTRNFRMETLERAAATAVRAGIAQKIRRFTLTAAAPDGISETAFLHAAARGAAWGSYSFNTFKCKSSEQESEPSLTVTGPFENTAACRKALTNAEQESKALLSTADLANLPGNEATPDRIAAWARSMAKANGLTCTVLGKTELKKKGCNALLAVAAGSAQDAKIITLKYSGKKSAKKPVVLIGKTITFDSGGISLKPGKGMGWMLYDKCGGMAVLAAMQMVARLKPDTPVIGMLAVAENMPGGNATRPGDIIKSHAGKTIEILNTDAEGRLALCDALSLALEHKPAAIVDLATLTGAVIVALGHIASAVIGNSRDLTARLIEAGAVAGERLWELPLWQEHKDDMKGTFADLQNIGKSGTAGTITAGAFLSEFVPDSIPWAHLDIAGTAWEESPKPWMAPGATLFGARTLIEWIKSL
jgi:leucyl aminopeptidase